MTRACMTETSADDMASLWDSKINRALPECPDTPTSLMKSNRLQSIRTAIVNEIQPFEDLMQISQNNSP
jgi:hypothetical protein